MFTEDVARNFVAPEDTVDAGLEYSVDMSVSTVLAAM